jgi:hypothetical protein
VLLLEAVLDRVDVGRAGRPPVVHARHVAGPEPDDDANQDPAPRRSGRPAPGPTYPRPRPGYQSKLTLLSTRLMFIQEGRILPESEMNTCGPSS